MDEGVVLAALATALSTWRDLLTEVTAEQLSAPTPNPGWTVADVIEHVIAVTTKFTAFARGDTDSPRSMNRERSDDGCRAAFSLVADAALAAWPAADLSRRCHLPFGDFSAGQAAGINLFDLLAHGWDIEQATTAAFVCPASTWRAGLHVARLVVGDCRDSTQFGPALAVPPGASPRRQLLTYLGRPAGG